MDDKDYEEVLRILKPKVKRVEIMTIHTQRATTLREIEKALNKAGLEYSYFDHKIDKNEQYLVFGSFYVVEAFFRKNKESCRVVELVRAQVFCLNKFRIPRGQEARTCWRQRILPPYGKFGSPE